MQTRVTSIFLALVLVLIEGTYVSAEDAKSELQVIDSNLLLGKWQKELRRETFTLNITISFNKDGTFASVAQASFDDGTKRNLEANGDWKIDGIYLIETVQKSNFAEIGLATRDKILSISATKFRYHSETDEDIEYDKVIDAK